MDSVVKTRTQVLIDFYYYAGMTNEFSFKIENFSTTLPEGSILKNTNPQLNHYA